MTSICSIIKGSIDTPWSKLKLEASKLLTPFCKILIRSLSIPLIIGRPAEGPKELLLTPGMLFNVSAKVFSRFNESSRPFKIEMGTTI